jgi:phage terminase Nu1 subunit (DNA packaging protein)
LENRFLHLIEVLVRHNVRFIIVGGVAAVLQRVPVNTQDFDLVHDRAQDNVKRVLMALAELQAVYRDDPRMLSPNESHLLGNAG